MLEIGLRNMLENGRCCVRQVTTLIRGYGSQRENAWSSIRKPLIMYVNWMRKMHLGAQLRKTGKEMLFSGT
jgi:hypothetical protein